MTDKAISDEVRREIGKQVSHAIRRPCKRVFIGKYIHADGTYNIYIQVEKEKERGK